MATTYEYLLRRKADLEVRMSEAQKRALAPFEGELRAINLALGAIERAGLSEDRVAGEPPSFVAPAPVPAPSRRGRRSRSTGDMILMALQRGGAGLGGAGLGAAEIVQQLERRWNRAVPVATVTLELQQLETDGVVTRSATGWTKVAGAPDADHLSADDSDIAKMA